MLHWRLSVTEEVSERIKERESYFQVSDKWRYRIPPVTEINFTSVYTVLGNCPRRFNNFTKPSKTRDILLLESSAILCDGVVVVLIVWTV